MILTVDIGNTTIALTVLDGEYNVLSAEKLLSDKNFREPLERILGGFPKIEKAVLSSVVPELTEPVCGEVERITGTFPNKITADSYHGILNFAIPEPQKLGLDRIADSAWAAVNFPLPAVTVDLGTATAFNVIDTGGIFLGGIISAGVQTSLNALSKHAAQLPKLMISTPGRLIGTNTVECMLSGAVFGAAAMIDGITARIESELKKPVTLVLTGGGARYVEAYLLHPHIHEPYLLAKGLALV